MERKCGGVINTSCFHKKNMKKGIIIFLTGVSSSGKTTLAKTLKGKLPVPFFHISKDMFMDDMAPEHLSKEIWPTKYETCTTLMIETVKLFSNLGNNVIVDSVRLEKEYADALNGYPVLYISVTCKSLDELRRREKQRGDRDIGQAEEQLRTVTPVPFCDMEIDTSEGTIEGCALDILSRLQEAKEMGLLGEIGDRGMFALKHAPVIPMYGGQKKPDVSIEQYLKNPCGCLPNAYWKSREYPVPEHMRILHERDYDGSPYAQKYFRLLHDLKEIETVVSDDYEVQNVNIDGQKELVARILSVCYNTEYSIEFVDGLTRISVFDKELWVLVVEKSTRQPAALGIADYDAMLKEGSLEWIQVLPGMRGLGLGKMVVNELLSRLATKATFVTVSGQVDNATNPERLYRKCGFTGDDIWYVIRME